MCIGRTAEGVKEICRKRRLYDPSSPEKMSRCEKLRIESELWPWTNEHGHLCRHRFWLSDILVSTDQGNVAVIVQVTVLSTYI